jgi:hypothetical protein
MAKRVTATIEILAFIVLAVLAVRWILNPNGNSEPWMALIALIGITGLDLFRRYWVNKTPDTNGVTAEQHRTVEQVIPELDEKSIGIMSVFGKVPYFSRPPAVQFDAYIFDQGVDRLRSLGCLRFAVSDDGKLYAYHWTELGKLVVTKYGYDQVSDPHQVPTLGTAIKASVSIPPISEKARKLLLNAVKDEHGVIIMIRTSGGFHVQTNNQQFVESRNARLEAEWKAAVEELLGCGFIEGIGQRGETFQVTAKGYSAAESLDETGSSDSGRDSVSPETGDPFRGIERRIEAVLEPEEAPVHEEEGWRAMTPRLVAVGISEQDIGRIREAMRNREIGLVDTRGRERLRFLVRGNQRIPVAILNRGNENHRVLFPDGRDSKVRVGNLNIIPK